MYMRPQAFLTPRKTYRDIADGFDRMGNVPGLAAPPGYYPAGYPGFMPSTGGGEMVGCPTCQPVTCAPLPPETAGRCVVVGLPRDCIPGCDCETIETSVCGPFTLTGLFISPKIASELSITRFRIGCWDLLANCDPVPAELFSCCEIDENQWSARPVDANSPICLTFENESEDDIRFSGAIKGVLCEPC